MNAREKAIERLASMLEWAAIQARRPDFLYGLTEKDGATPRDAAEYVLRECCLVAVDPALVEAVEMAADPNRSTCDVYVPDGQRVDVTTAKIAIADAVLEQVRGRR